MTISVGSDDCGDAARTTHHKSVSITGTSASELNRSRESVSRCDGRNTGETTPGQNNSAKKSGTGRRAYRSFTLPRRGRAAGVEKTCPDSPSSGHYTSDVTPNPKAKDGCLTPPVPSCRPDRVADIRRGV